MVRSSSCLDWWQSGKDRGRLNWLGVLLGMSGGVAFSVFSSFGYLNPSSIVFGMVFLFIEIPVGVIIGLMVATVAMLAIRVKGLRNSRLPISARAGAAAFLAQSLLIFSLFSIYPYGGIGNWVAVLGTGPIAGVCFAALAYLRFPTSSHPLNQADPEGPFRRI